MANELAAYLHYTALENSEGGLTEDRLATLVINRHEAANSFSGELLVQLKKLLGEVNQDPTVRALLLQGSGKHFSAGADLHWMKEAAQLDYAGNVQEAEKLTAMFEALATLRVPTLAVAKGAAFGGAVGLIAACDYAVALDNARFCLSEVKIGLLPAVILPYLGRKMHPGALKRLMLTARVFQAEDALSIGLVQAVTPADGVEALLHDELNLLLNASPEAQATCKGLYQKVEARSWAQGPETVEAIARTRASSMGQAGLSAFFEKKDPVWLRRVPRSARVFVP
jgi:methylglutaconyl-CoA hydratase